jgi:hypothetical protein
VFVVWLDLAESQRTASDVQRRRPRSVQIVPIARLAVEHRGEVAHARLHPEGFVFELRSAATNETSFPVGETAARAIQRSLPSAKSASITIDKGRAGGLSSEKIFVAVCERPLTHAAEARTASHTAPQWTAQSISS